MLSILERLKDFIWGVPGLVMILGTGLYLTCATGFAQVRLFPEALRSFLRPFMSRHKYNNGSSYRALCTALAATVGTGNLAGVAGAIAIGGPGAVFWMWICGLVGMVIKFAEATLAVRYRVINAAGERIGGPMYMIASGLSQKYHWLAGVYCFLALVASFGIGNGTQINTVVQSLRFAFAEFGINWSIGADLLTGLILSVLLGILLFGGGARIGAAAQALVPFAAVSYIMLCGYVLFVRYAQIPAAFRSIILGAVSPEAVTGGVVGSAYTALRIGASRGVFTNEAGMGTAGIAHGAADVKHPVEQGYMGIVEVFIDTVVICTLTALVILCSGVPIPYGTDPGIQLTNAAFTQVCGQWVNIFISISLCLFAVATVLGWGLYGGRCAQYLFGEGAWKYYAGAQTLMVVAAALFQSDFLWSFSEVLNGLMAIPNLIALLLLSPALIKLLREYCPERSRKT